MEKVKRPFNPTSNFSKNTYNLKFIIYTEDVEFIEDETYPENFESVRVQLSSWWIFWKEMYVIKYALKKRMQR